MTDTTNTILRALETARGDDLYRARRAWGNLPDSELDKEYGESGRTRRQIMEGYAENERRINQAVDWVKERAND